MNSSKPAILLLALLGVAILQVLYYHPKLPDTIAHHFGASGAADAWGSKTTFLLVDLALMVFLVALFLLLSRLPFKIPDNMWNIPHREYWLAPERRQKTAQMTASYLLWLGAFTVLFLRVLMQQVYAANLAGPPQRLEHIWLVLSIFLAGTGVLTWRFCRGFYHQDVFTG